MPFEVPAAKRVGPGKLYIAPLESTLPTDLATAWDAAWVELGYTEEGHEFEIAPTFEDLEVAESLEPLDTFETTRLLNVRFTARQYTARNLQIAQNGGTIVTGTGIVTFEPPETGDRTAVMIGWEADDNLQRKVWKQCIQTGSVTTAARKAPTAQSVPMDFRVLVPDDGSIPWFEIFEDTLDGLP